MFDSNNFTSVLNVFFPKCMAHEDKAVYTLSYFSIRPSDIMHLQCKSRRGGGEGGSVDKGWGFDAWDYHPVGLLIVRSDPGVGTFDFDRQKPGINSETFSKSIPRGFLKVMLLEKGVKVSFVLIALIRYFKLSSKQIMSILRKFLSSSSHLIVKLDWNRIPPWKSEDFLQVTDPTCSDMLSRCYKAFYVSLIL